jgi:dTDP-4-dehydrorhamnose reductase
MVAGHLLRTAPAEEEVHVTWRNTPAPPGVPAYRIHLERETLEPLLRRVRPEVVVHTAYSMARRDDIVDASAAVADDCARAGVALVHLSSDVVFDGEHPPYGEHCEPDPVSEYGRWKLAAEQVVLAALPDACITRNSLVVSMDPPDPGTGSLLRAVRAGERPQLFDDEMRSAIRAEDLAMALWALVGRPRAERAGVWHLPGPEPLSRLEIGRRILGASGLDPRAVTGRSSRDHPEPRPRDLTLVSVRPWPGPAPLPVP